MVKIGVFRQRRAQRNTDPARAGCVSQPAVPTRSMQKRLVFERFRRDQRRVDLLGGQTDAHAVINARILGRMDRREMANFHGSKNRFRDSIWTGNINKMLVKSAYAACSQAPAAR